MTIIRAKEADIQITVDGRRLDMITPMEPMEPMEQRIANFYSFMIERENIRLRRSLGWPRDQWTLDPIFQKYSFTNVKRECDRTTTLFMKEFYSWFANTHMSTVYGPDWRADPNEDELAALLINCALFRYFGCIETARLIGWTELWDNDRKSQIINYGIQGDLRFTAAYIVPNCGRSESKYEVVVDIIDGIASRSREIVSARNSWQKQCAILSSCYGCGSFMAKEILLDYILASGMEPTDWQTWTPVGPGGRRGASRVKYGYKTAISENESLDVIREVYEKREQYWRSDFVDLDLTDIQFQFCEFDKYSRVAEGKAPKRRFKPTVDEITNGVIKP